MTDTSTADGLIDGRAEAAKILAAIRAGTHKHGDIRDIGRLLDGNWDQDLPAAILEAAANSQPAPTINAESELVARLWTAAERLNRSLPGNDLAELYAQAAATIERLHSTHEQGRREVVTEAMIAALLDLELAENGQHLKNDHRHLVTKWTPRIEAMLAIAALSSAPPGEKPDEGHPHLIGGEFQSDKYPTCPRGKVPLSVKDKAAQDLLWEYAQRRRAVDAEFASDLEIALKAKGYDPAAPRLPAPTCPAIDQIILLLENLRNDNAQLRMGVLHYEALYRESAGEKGERIPSGWKLVPVEPTERMLTTGSTARYHAGDKLGHATTRDVWTAMLAASPPPAKAEDGIEIVREAREHVALRLDGMERIGATAEAKRSARSLLQRMDAALAKEGTP